MGNHEGVAAIGRDAAALEAFYREHVEAVQRFVARRVDSPEDAADLTAEVFLAAMDASRRYRGDGAGERAWLYGVARRVAAQHRRSAHRAALAHRRIDARALLDDDAVERATARIDAERATRAAYRLLDDLPERQRAVVELVAVDCLSLVEAADALGISAGAARVRYHRARTRLAAALPTPTEVVS